MDGRQIAHVFTPLMFFYSSQMRAIFYPVFSIAVCLKNGTQFYINTPHGTLSEAKYAMMCLAEIVN